MIHPWLDPAVWLTTTLSILQGTSAATNEKDVYSGSVCFLKRTQESQGVTIGKRLTDKKVEELPAPGQYEARSVIQEGPQYFLYLQHNQYL